ncbi:leucine-rich repeat and guanylate kinase domain-containing protein isoform X6 [Apis cerana]|uniref:Dynein axonemal assembly factor 1 homolog n=1 Tax=Apis cerana cerana TaxID=94128 RepID=A0A2A3EFI7_APICC|nr:leucine-rich repeat and guanylate kinase domain-containing protein isoform X6 [Apis cerana]PBC29751.1 Leucine-rich repeat and guanylate kinase domain-containing protein [Apis cerana cerana]
MGDDKNNFPYLFSPSEPLFIDDAISKISIPEEPLKEDDTFIEEDSDLLSHSQMSWKDGFLTYEVLPAELTFETDIPEFDLPFTLFDEKAITLDERVIKCVTESKWSSHSLDFNLWNDDKAPVVKLRNLKEILYDDLEFCGFVTDRLIGSGKSFLTKSPENGLYVLSKCIMRNMSLSNITMLSYHRYLQYIDLAYNYISNLSPLEGIPYLMYLNVAHNRMNTILNFSPPWYLTYVNLSYNYITKMCDISDFWSIVHLDLSHNAIEIITGLQNLKYLKYLNLSYNLIEYIENLDKLNIQELNLEGNCILSFKCAIPGYGINILSHLRKLYLGYNKISSLEFFKDAYSLRVIDLKFNRINDLLELLNLKGLIHEVDFRGNNCTKWPNYKAVLLFSLPSIQIIDGVNVFSSEKIAAATLFTSPINLTAARTITKLTLLEQLSIPKIDLHVTPYDELSPPLIILTGPSAVKKLALALHTAQTLTTKVKYCPWYSTKNSETVKIENPYYIFVTREEFNDMSRRGEFLAIQELLGHSYGFHHNEIVSLKLEKKIGITQTDLHATIQMSKRYSNSKAVLVLTSDVKIHNEWIKEKFYVYTSTLQDNAEKKSKENLVSEEKTMSTESDINFIKDILNNIINNLNSISNFTSIKYIDEIETDVLFKTFNKNIEIEKQNPKQKENKPNNNKFPKPRLFSELKDFEVLLNENKELRVILDEQANIIIEDEELKRKRHQARLLQRRDTLMQLDPAAELEYDESVSSEELPIQITPEMEEPEYMKNFYTKLILQSRNIYMDQHLNNPGFFSLVLLTDDYVKSFNTLINFIHDSYINYSFEKSESLSELTHFSKVAITTMINSIVDEIKESSSTSILKKKTLLRMYGVNSWKDLMPSQKSSINIDN